MDPTVKEKVTLFLTKLRESLSADIRGDTRRSRIDHILQQLDQLTSDDARWVVEALVGRGMDMRMKAYYAADQATRAAIPGGFITRSVVHDLSPEADELDHLALAIANARPDWTPEYRLRLCTG